MQLNQYVSTIGRWRWLVIGATLIGAISAQVMDAQSPRYFRAATTLMVGQYLQSSQAQAADITLSQQLAESYTLAAKRPALLQATIARLQLNDSTFSLARRVNASSVPQSPLFQVAVVDIDPLRAVAIANGIAYELIQESPTPQQDETNEQREFIGQQVAALQARIADAQTQQRELDNRLGQETSARGIQDLQGQSQALQDKITSWQSTYTSLLEQYRGARVNYLSVQEPAYFAIPVTSSFPINTIVAGLAGAMLAILAALVVEYMDDTVRVDDGRPPLDGPPVIGAIPRVASAAEHDLALVVLAEPRSLSSEAYRSLRALIDARRNGGPSHRLLVASSLPEEGKSTVVANLAATIAQSGKRVIVCDADLHRPSLHTLFGVPCTPGISDLLRDSTMPIDSALHSTLVPGLQLLPSGPSPENPAALLSSDAMRERMRQLDQLADIVIVDSPASLAVSDTAILAAICGQVVLVAAAGRTHRGQLHQARQALEDVGATILGIVLNKVPATRNRAYEYYARADANGPPAAPTRRSRLTGPISWLFGRVKRNRKPRHKR